MIFGLIASVDSSDTIIVLVFTLLVLYGLGLILSRFRTWADINRHGQAFEKIERQLLQLGLISFGLFLFNPSNYGDTKGDISFSGAFHFTHLLILFIAIAFVLQSFFMLKVCFKCLSYLHLVFLKFELLCSVFIVSG